MKPFPIPTQKVHLRIKQATGELWDGSVQGGQQIFVFRGFLALKSDVKHRLVKSYHLYSHIFLPSLPHIT